MRALTLISAAAAFGILVSGAVLAKTPDGKTPASETVCENETGAAWGLCNAYCEAMDCDENPQASQRACYRVGGKFISITGRALPCELPDPVTCPCTTFDLDVLQTAEWGDPGYAECRAGPAGPEMDLDVIGGVLFGPGMSCYTSIRSAQDLGEGAFCEWRLQFADDCTNFNGGYVEFISPEEVDACQTIIRQMAELLGAACPDAD